MDNEAPATTGTWFPTWAKVLVSVALIFHLTALFSKVLSAPSGPWPTRDNGEIGEDFDRAPEFAALLNERLIGYHRATQLINNYHFLENEPAVPGLRFEARLLDAEGKETAVLQFPDPKANGVVQHRQRLLARALNVDRPVAAPDGTWVPAPGKRAPIVTYWRPVNEGRSTVLTEQEQNLLPRDEVFAGPSTWSIANARSFARYLARVHGAAGVEIIRYTRPNYFPPMLNMGLSPADLEQQFNEQPASFGVYHAERKS